jgi:hypothetical protein
VNIRNGVPDATYLMSITCVEYFGTLTTNSEGQAAGHFVVSDVPPVFHVRAYDAADNDRFHSQTLTAG